MITATGVGTSIRPCSSLCVHACARKEVVAVRDQAVSRKEGPLRLRWTPTQRHPANGRPFSSPIVDGVPDMAATRKEHLVNPLSPNTIYRICLAARPRSFSRRQPTRIRCLSTTAAWSRRTAGALRRPTQSSRRAPRSTPALTTISWRSTAGALPRRTRSCTRRGRGWPRTRCHSRRRNEGRTRGRTRGTPLGPPQRPRAEHPEGRPAMRFRSLSSPSPWEVNGRGGAALRSSGRRCHEEYRCRQQRSSSAVVAAQSDSTAVCKRDAAIKLIAESRCPVH